MVFCCLSLLAAVPIIGLAIPYADTAGSKSGPVVTRTATVIQGKLERPSA